MSSLRRSLPLGGLALLLVVACSVEMPSATNPDSERPEDAAEVELSLSADDQAEADALFAEVDETSSLSAEGLLERYGLEHSELSYDPGTAEHLDLIQASSLALDDAALEKLGENGFVISAAREFPSFVYGYQTIYAEDLPVYVSADSILDAVHRSYDEILKQIELGSLSVELEALLGELSSRLGSVEDKHVRADLDVYLTVADSLLAGEFRSPAAGGSWQATSDLYQTATLGGGLVETKLFGVPRTIDFSQFKPRGHYADSKALERYFRAMMWLGRIDFRLIETKSSGEQVFYRSQFDAMVALAALFDDASRARLDHIDRTIAAFVGESDYMTLQEVPHLVEELGGAGALAEATDADIAGAIALGGFGSQRIATDIIVSSPDVRPLPLNRSFAVLGQRYVLDSHVFSNVVWDRTEKARMLPDPLDVAFAALGNDQAAALLEPELEEYDYAGDLHAVRYLADRHDEAFWDENLYNVWLSALRALSPGELTSAPTEAGMPEVTGTEPWGRRILNTQLASWAELRHDTILYAKQSYTSGAECEFPDGYVDPYPELYGALERLADLGVEITGRLEERAAPAELTSRLSGYFAELKTVSTTLREMAEHQQTGTPFTDEQLAFINESVGTASNGCETDGAVGWYARLFFENSLADDFDPTIADVHTQPTDEVGNEAGKVLHVGTGQPRLMVVTTNTCSGPRAYVGLASSYYEHVTDDFERLNDEEWANELTDGDVSDVPWMAPIIAQ